jgi:hypothetical protein
MQREVQGHTRGGPAGSRTTEWRDQEGVDEEAPSASWLPEGAHPQGTQPPLTGEEVEARSRLGRAIPRSVLPADRKALLAAVDRAEVPQDIRDALRARLPANRTYGTVYEIWEALGHRNE